MNLRPDMYYVYHGSIDTRNAKHNVENLRDLEEDIIDLMSEKDTVVWEQKIIPTSEAVAIIKQDVAERIKEIEKRQAEARAFIEKLPKGNR